MQSKLEDHQDVKNFLNTEVPTIDIMAKAYFARDNFMNLSFENNKESMLEKLCYTSEKIQKNINYKFKNYLYSLVDKFLTDPKNDAEYNFLDEFNKFMASEEIKEYIETRKKRYDMLNAIDNHQDFYKAMTMEELVYLGW